MAGSKFDPRITPARGDIAASQLKGKVEAARYVDGVKHTIACGRTPLRQAPSPDAGLESELLFGQTFVVYDRSGEFLWGQALDDDCVGYLSAVACRAGEVIADHKTSVLATPLLPAPDAKRAALDILPLNAKVRVCEYTEGFARIEPQGFVFRAHLIALSQTCDWVGVAERFLGVPYVWGGKSFAGLDCSGLVQVALEFAGKRLPRDTDLQEKAIATKVEPSSDLSNLQRGDLVFWDGHVGIMLDRARLLHATSAYMQAVIEPLHEAVRRIEPIGGAITSIRRLRA